MFTIKPLPKNEISNKLVEVEMVEVTPNEPTRIGDIEVQPQRFVMPNVPIELLESYHYFSVRKDDVWIVTYPKCGTTWMQELCWLILNNYDFETAKDTDLDIRSPYLEYNLIIPKEFLDSLELLEKSKSPRLIKTHFCIGLLPKELWTKNPKIIHVIRDPRDAAISLYHMLSGQGMTNKTLEEYLTMFLSDNITTFWDHALEFWKLRHNPNYLFITFEEMKKDLAAVIKKVCTFLDRSITAEQMEQMLHHLSFESMKDNEMLNHNLETSHKSALLQINNSSEFKFMRKGEIGSHKSDFPPKFIGLFNEWVHKNLKDSDFSLYLET